MQHNKTAVHTFNGKLFEDLKKKLPELECIDIFSDGAAQHFKQKYTLCNITYGIKDYNLYLNWHFFATSHGNEAVDGVGGMIKHHVWQKVKSRTAFVYDASSFFKCASSITEKVNIVYVPQEDIIKETSKLEERWEDIERLPQTHEIHCVRTEKINVVRYSKTSDKKGNVFVFKNNLMPLTRWNLSDKPVTPMNGDIQFGKWVLAEFKSDRQSVLQFVGQIIENPTKSKATVKFLKKSGNKYVWPVVEDVVTIEKAQIIRVLPEPVTDSREKLSFPELCL